MANHADSSGKNTTAKTINLGTIVKTRLRSDVVDESSKPCAGAYTF